MQVEEAVAADGVLDRIKLVTDELEALHSDIHLKINDLRSLTDVSASANTTATALEQFKATLDQLRKVLWSYLEQTDAGEAISRTRTQSLQGSSKMLEPRYPLVDVPPGTAPVSFFDRLDVVIDAYMKKSEASTSPVVRKRGKR